MGRLSQRSWPRARLKYQTPALCRRFSFGESSNEDSAISYGAIIVLDDARQRDLSTIGSEQRRHKNPFVVVCRISGFVGKTNYGTTGRSASPGYYKLTTNRIELFRPSLALFLRQGVGLAAAGAAEEFPERRYAWTSKLQLAGAMQIEFSSLRSTTPRVAAACRWLLPFARHVDEPALALMPVAAQGVEAQRVRLDPCPAGVSASPVNKLACCCSGMKPECCMRYGGCICLLVIAHVP